MDLRELLSGTENFQIIKWPGTDIDIMMKILSDHEIQQARFATEKLFKEQKISYDTIFTADAYQGEYVTQMLYQSLSFPSDNTQKVCPTITDFRKCLTQDVKAILSDSYMQFQKDKSPQLDNMSKEEFDVLFNDLKKKPDSITGKVLSSSMLKKLFITSVSQPEILPPVNG